MDHLTDFRGLFAVIGGVLALVAIVIIVARLMRSRRPPEPPTTAIAPSPGDSAAFLDSSHVISGPVLSGGEPLVRGDDGAKGPERGPAP